MKLLLAMLGFGLGLPAVLVGVGLALDPIFGGLTALVLFGLLMVVLSETA